MTAAHSISAQKTAPVVSMPMIEALPVVQDNELRTAENTGWPTNERTNKSGGVFGGITADGARQFKDDLLDRLAENGHLWPGKEANEALQMAGIKYHADWYGAGMGGLQAIDYGKVSGGQGGSGSSMPPSRMAAQARASYRAARAAMPEPLRKPVELILLEGQSDLISVGKAITGASQPHLCRAVALERFKFGLYLLAKHYVFLA